MPHAPHVVVIGAGPAGSVAAIALARRGVGVTLCERATFPRDKVCGECVSALGLEVLGRLDLRAAIDSLGPARLEWCTLVSPDGRSHTLAMPRPMAGVRRSTMDAALLDAARAAGVRVEQPMAVTRLEPGDRPRAFLRDGRVIACDHVVIADGTSALLAGRPMPTGDFGLKAHFADVDAPRDAIELVGLGGDAYAGLAPVDGGLYNAAWSVPAEAMRLYGGDLDRLFADHVARHPRLKVCFARACRIGDWLACPLPRFSVRDDWPAGVVPIGNAAAALEPVGGEGMGLAMRSGELAATAISDAAGRGNRVDVSALRAAFRSLWTTRRLACRAAAVTLSDARWGPLAIDAARCVPALARGGLRLVGK